MQLSHNSKFILSINILLGLSLWFGTFTDFEYRIPLMNVLFPFLVLGIGLRTITKLNTPRNILRNLLCLPSIVGGVPYTFFAILVIVNPFAWSWANRITNVELVNSYKSTDGKKTAEGYIFPGSNYEMKTYNIEVKLPYKFFPLVVRHVFGDDHDIIFRIDEIENYKLNWINNDELSITYEGKTVSNRDKTVLVNKLNFVTPMSLELLLFMFHLR